MFIKEIEVSELSEMFAQKQPIRLIDVRSPAEIAAGIIPGAEALPLHLLPLRSNDLPRQEQVIFYCRTGARSAQACMFLAQYGYDNVYNLRGGIVTWAQNGLPIAPGLDAIG
jgi:rhodanese-related sulfurtransferase